MNDQEIREEVKRTVKKVHAAMRGKGGLRYVARLLRDLALALEAHEDKADEPQRQADPSIRRA